MSIDGTPGCQCKMPRITIAGVCSVCGKERVHILPKVPPVYVSPNVGPFKDAA